MNIINIILVLILISLNFQYYNLNEESKMLKETILELKDQNQTLSYEINKMSVANANTSYTTNSTLNSILYFGGLVLIAGIAFYFLNGYLLDTNTQSLEASKIINQTTSDYTNNLMNQIHSQNLSQINWLDKKFDSLITIIQKANIFNNQWFIENVMPTLNAGSKYNYPAGFDLGTPGITGAGEHICTKVSSQYGNMTVSSSGTSILDSNVHSPFKINFIEKEQVSKYFENPTFSKLGESDYELLKVMEKTLETAEWI